MSLNIALILFLAGVSADTCNCVHGECIQVLTPDGRDSICTCLPDFSGATCDCERKDMKLALILSGLVGWAGADRLYLGRPLTALLKVALPVIMIMIGLVCIANTYLNPKADISYGVYDSTNSKKYEIGKCFVLCGAAFMVAWWLGDFLSILSGDLDDASCGALRR